jgi:integrase
MTTIRIAGVKGYVSNGQPYFYLRASGERIVDPGTRRQIDPVAEPAAFAARVEEMKKALAGTPAPIAKAATLLDLVEFWRGSPGTNGRPRREPSLEWLALRPATRKSYERMIDPERGYLRRGLRMKLDRLYLSALETPNVVAMRDKVAQRFGFWTGNYVVKVLRPLFKWARLHGHMKANPAADIPLLKRPADLPVQHPSWSDLEFETMLTAARAKQWHGVVLTFALARFAGWAIGDCISQPPAAWQDPRLVYIRKKSRSRKLNSVRAPKRLAAILREFPPDPSAETLVTNSRGERYTEDGMRSMVWKLCTELAEKKKVRPGLNIHGLRHSLGKELYDLGLEREARKAMLAHESDEASKVYERDGDRRIHADKAVVALNRRRRRNA